MTSAANGGERLSRAEEKVREYLARYGGTLPATQVILDPDLDEETMATHRYPATVVVREPSVPKSVIAHELVHIAQGTLEHFRGFRLLYVLLAEGLADKVNRPSSRRISGSAGRHRDALADDAGLVSRINDDSALQLWLVDGNPRSGAVGQCQAGVEPKG